MGFFGVILICAVGSIGFIIGGPVAAASLIKSLSFLGIMSPV